MIVLHDSETPIMTAVEELFALEIEFHRKLRMSDPRPTDVSSLHTSYALQAGYEQLIRDAGDVTGVRLRMIRESLLLTHDARDVFVANDSLKRMLRISYLNG